MNPRKSLEKAYVAGLVDGEGSISLTSYLHRIGREHWVLKVGISNRYLPVLEQLRTQYEGNIHRSGSSRAPNRQPCYEWILTGRDRQIRFLLDVQPFARIKQEQVKLALSYLRTIGSGSSLGRGKHLTTTQEEKRAALQEAMGILNKRGV